MNKQPLISVIIPAYNCSKYIEESINSILEQTYKNLELLIADDNSSDNTFQQILNLKSKDHRIVAFRNKKNIGYLKTCNFLFEKTTGEYITFQDADDFSLPQRIELQFNFLEKNKEIGLCSANYQRFDNSRKFLEKSNNPPTDIDVRNLFVKETSFPVFPGAIMIRRAVYEDIGGYRDFFDRIASEDIDWILLISEKYKVHNLEPVLYYYRFNPMGVTQHQITIDKAISKEIVWFLKEQREKRGYDDLMSGDTHELDTYIATLRKPFLDDPSKIFRMNALSALNHREFKKAAYFIFKALCKNPFEKSNYQSINLYRSLFFN